mmetsp:Transcript_6405/g.18874  ORF Transcript_6405/g.18874 Transcript_6405/m.18874 type:complete len:220 (+) Transcript_6405:75-734(+)
MPLPTEPHELVYFDFNGGRAEPIRIVFTAIGLDFKDVRLKREEFMAKKKDGLYPTGVPVLKIGDVEHTQSIAILRYAAMLGQSMEGDVAQLYPADPMTALITDQAIDTAQDMMAAFPRKEDPDEMKQAREEYMAGKGKTFLGQLEALIKRADGPYIGGKYMTIADLSIALGIVKGIQNGMFDYVPTTFIDDNFPEMTNMAKHVAENPIVVDYYKKLEAK